MSSSREPDSRATRRDAAFEVSADDPERLDGILRARLDLSWGAARELVKRGKVEVDGIRATAHDAQVPRAAKIEVRPHAPRRDATLLDDRAIVHVDPHLVVVRKPAGISTIPYEPGERGTLEERTRLWLVRKARHPSHASLGVVHRIDKDTSGLVVFTRTLAAKKVMTQAFRVHAVERRYVAIVHGVLSGKRSYESFLIQDRGDGLRGSAKDRRVGERAGQRAVTHVAAMTALSDRATLVACALETGRTHQIRIHLSEARMPIVGDRVYTRDRARAGLPLIEAPRLMLHAMVLGFSHPVSGQPLRFSDALPEDMGVLAASLAGRPISVDPSALPI